MAENKELSPYLRGQIVGMHRVGIKTGEIARLMKFSPSTVSTIIGRYKEDPDNYAGESKPRAGRPVVIGVTGHRRLIREALKERRAPLREITQNYNTESKNPVSTKTVSNYLCCGSHNTIVF